MLYAMSFGASTGGEECMSCHTEAWGVAKFADGYEPYRPYPDFKSALAYAKTAVLYATSFLEKLEDLERSDGKLENSDASADCDDDRPFYDDRDSSPVPRWGGCHMQD